MYCAEGSENG